MISSIINFVKSKISSTQIETVVPLIKNAVQQIDPTINNDNVINFNNKSWKKYFPFTMFFGNDEFQPIYFWITLFCGLIFFMLFIKVYNAYLAVKKGIFTSDMISTSDLGVVLGFISSLILLYNGNKKNQSTFNPTIVSSTTQVTTDTDNKSQEGDSQP